MIAGHADTFRGLKARRAWRREVAFRAMCFLKNNDFRGAWRLRETLRNGRSFLSPDGYVRCSTLYGFDIVVRPLADRGVEAQIFREGTYEEGTLAVIGSVLRPGDVFLDVGANVGLMSLYAAKAVGKRGSCHAFEPMSELADMLELSKTIGGFDNLYIHRVGLGSVHEERQIFAHDEINRGSSSFMDWHGHGHEQGKTAVISKMDQFVESTLQAGSIRFVKIDVEGWELEVLKGSTRVLSTSDAPGLCVEYSTLHPLEGGRHTDLYGVLRELGYAVFRLERGKSASSKLRPVPNESELPQHDNLFAFKSAMLESLEPGLFA